MPKTKKIVSQTEEKNPSQMLDEYESQIEKKLAVQKRRMLAKRASELGLSPARNAHYLVLKTHNELLERKNRHNPLFEVQIEQICAVEMLLERLDEFDEPEYPERLVEVVSSVLDSIKTRIV